jgi:D-lactate dehydrogenase (cytochrome)
METPMLASSKSASGDVATAIAVLRQRFGDRLQTGEAIRRQHANTITWIPNQPPDAVIWVETQDEVCEVVRVASTHRVPIIPFGAGTSLEGHINARAAPVARLLAHEPRARRHPARSRLRRGADVSRKQLSDYLRDMGCFSRRSRRRGGHRRHGGNARLGTTAVRYGTMRETCSTSPR